jgi:PadR family transcriptional regulator PadR
MYCNSRYEGSDFVKVNKEMLKGCTVILVLSLLERKSMYGYEMIKELEKKSNGVFAFKEGTLYPILHSLEANNLIESYWDENEGARKRKYYRITEEGKKEVKEKQKEWKVFTEAMDQVLWEGITWG